MSDPGKPCCSNPKQVLWTLAIFALFGFLALLVTGRLDSKSPANRAFEGEFTDATTRQRWANFKEVEEAQRALFDPAKVAAALEAIAKAPGKPEPSTIVVPGSPTFLKQMEQQAAPAPAAPGAAAPGAAAPAKPAAPAPAPAQTAPAPQAPAAPANAPKASGNPAAPAAPAPVAPAANAPAPAPKSPAAPAPAPKAPGEVK